MMVNEEKVGMRRKYFFLNMSVAASKFIVGGNIKKGIFQQFVLIWSTLQQYITIPANEFLFSSFYLPCSKFFKVFLFLQLD